MPTSVTVSFRAGREDCASLRIPAAVVARAGTLLAFCEGRVDSWRDWGHIDIVVKRSVDAGPTWGPLKVAASNGVHLAGNLAPSSSTPVGSCSSTSVPLPPPPRIILRDRVTDADGRRVRVQHSDDDGLAWSSPRRSPGRCQRQAGAGTPPPPGMPSS